MKKIYRLITLDNDYGKETNYGYYETIEEAKKAIKKITASYICAYIDEIELGKFAEDYRGKNVYKKEYEYPKNISLGLSKLENPYKVFRESMEDLLLNKLFKCEEKEDKE